MKYVYLTLTWVFGILAILIAFVALTTSFRAALCLFAVGALLLPPIRDFVFSKTTTALPVQLRAVIIVILLGSFVYFTSIGGTERAEEAAAEEARELAEIVAQRKKKNADFFNANRETIIFSAQTALAEKDYAKVISNTSQYLAAGDQELNEIHDEAKSTLTKIEKAEEARLAKIKEAEDSKKEEVRREKRTVEILAELKTIPVSKYAKNKGLYAELVKYHPYEAVYKERLDFYSGKVKEQWEKERAAAQRDKKKRQDRLAKFGERPTQSGWDGSYSPVKRYLERIANDPDSIDIDNCTEVYYTKDGWLVGCDYRGRNAFGGMIRQSNWFIIVHGTVISMKESSAYNP